MLATLVLSIALISSNPASAQAAAVDGEQASEEIVSLAAEVARLEAAVKAAEAKCPPPARRPRTTSSSPVSTSATPPTQNAELVQALAALEAARVELAAAKAALEAKTNATLASPEVKVTVQPTPVTIDNDVTVVVEGNPTHLIGYIGGGAVFGESVPGVSGPVAGRVVAGVRPSWDMGDGDTFQFGLAAEGSYESRGMGVRGVAALLITGSTGEWGIGGGVGYACNGWVGEGCLANYYGGVFQGTWTPASGPLGPMVFLDVEFGGLSASRQSEPAEALRVVTGLTLRLGNAHPKKVTDQ